MLDCTGYGFDFEGSDNSASNGIKTINMDCGQLSAAYWVVIKYAGSTFNLTAKNATITTKNESLYMDNEYVESDDGIAGNGSVSTIVLENVTHTGKYLFNTQKLIHSNITITGGSYTCTGHVFQLDYSGSVLDIDITNATLTSLSTAGGGQDWHVFNIIADSADIDVTITGGEVTAAKRILNSDKAATALKITLDGGNYTAGAFAFYFKTTNASSLFTAKNGVSIKAQWALVSEGLTRASIASDTVLTTTSGVFAYARTAHPTDGTTVYGNLANIVAFAPANATIEVSGTPGSMATVTIDKNLTITGIGKITAASGQSLFTVKNGAKLTIGGSTAYVYNAKGIVIGEGGGHVVITDTVTFTTTSTSQNGAVVYDELGNVNTTVEILKSTKGAPVLTTKGWAIDFEGDDNTAFTGIKTVTINGATITGGTHPVVFNVSGVTGNVTIKNATMDATAEVVYINNKYFESNDNVARNGNVFNLYIENATLTANTNIILVKAGATVNATIHSGTFTSTGSAGALLQTDKSGTYDVDLKMYGGTLTKSQYAIVFWADGTGNVLLEEKNNNTISFTTNSNMLYSGNTAKVSFNIKGGTYTAGSNFAVAASSSNVNYTLNGGTYVAKGSFFAMESNSVTTANVQNVNAKSGYNSATGTYVTEYGYGIVFGSNSKSTFTIGGENTVMRSPLRVFAIHDNSNVTLNIDGGVYENTTTTHTKNRFVIYQSSANGAASTLNLTAKNADFLCYAPIDGSAAFQINDAGSSTTASFDNCLLRGPYVIRQNDGTLDLTIKGNTRIEVIGLDADRTGSSGATGSGLFLGGAGKQKTVKLISGIITCVDKTETIEIDGESVVISPNGKLNGINLREDVVVDFVMEKDFSIIANGGFGIKNNKGRSQNSKFVFNGGTVRSSGVALGIYLRTTDNTKPSTLVINGGTFQSDSGNALQFYSDKNLAIGHVYGGTFTSNTNTAIYVHAGNITADGVVTFEGHAELNVHDCVCISEANDASLYASGGASNLTDGMEAIINVYGGYFEGHQLCAARASHGGKLSIWGGTFRYKNSDAGHWGAPVRAGTGSEIGVVDIYGGNYYSTSTAASGLFTRMNAYSFLTVHGGFNGIGGRVVAEYLYKNAEGKDANEKSLTITHKIGTQVACNSIYMIDGAAVRLVNGSNGLRFKSVVSAEAMAYINSIADAGSVKFGTLITPADFLENAYTFTAAELDRLGLKYIDLVAEDGLTVNEDGSYTICAAITNIKEENIDRNFAATSYVEYTVDGNTIRVYSNYRELKNTRSIAQVARIALSFGNRYTAAQREVLELYAPDEAAPVIDLYLIAGQSNGAGCSNFTADFKNSDPNFTNGYSNVLYHGVSVGGSDYPTKRIYTNVPVKAGYGCGTSDIGPELGMAKALSQYYNEETGRMAAIVKYAYGGTGLADTISGQNFPEGSWCPPSWLAEHGKVDEYKSGGLYRAFVMQIQSAVSDYRALGYDVNIIGGYWMQGENDRNKGADIYADMFEYWLADLRNDVYSITRDEADLKMPVIVGSISDYFGDNYHDNNLAFTQMQREQIGALENVHVLNNNTIPTVDHSNDKAHWDSHSALWIGQQVGITFMNEYLDTAYVVSDEDLVAEITLGGEVIGRYDSLVGAINDAPEGAVIELKKDLTLYSTLAIGNRNAITLNGNGHKIDFVLPASENHTSMIIWYDTNMTVNDLHIKQNATNAWGTQLRHGADVTWNNGSIDATQFCFVTNTANTNLTINGGSFSVSDGKWDYSAVIYFGNYDSKLTVTDGTFVANGLAVGVRISDQVLATITGGDWTVNGGDYILELLGSNNTLVLDKENVTLNEGYKIAPIYNAGLGHVEDDGMGDIFED